jgi:cellulose synthase (UDP-forming)
MGLDFWNANLFCGSAALIRRSALEHVGGIGTTSVTEDAETSLELHSRGYHSGFMKRPLVVGLAPDTLQTFVGQRSRWSQGMIQLLMLKNPLFKSGLNIAQRLCYLSSMIFWLFPIARLFFIVAPFFYIFFGLKIFEARVNEFMVFVLPHIFVLLTLTNHMTGSTRWPFLSDLYETLMAPYLVKPVLSAIWNPKNPKFNVTPKNESVDQAHVSSAAGPLVLMTLLILAAEIVGIIRYFQFPLEREHLTIVLSWNTVNLILATAALGVAFERPVRGLRKLLPLKQPVQVLTADGEQLPGLAVQGDPDRLAIRVAHLGAGGGTGAKLAVARSFEGEATGTPVPATVIGTGMSDKGPEIIVKLEPVEPIERITAVELAYGTSQELNNFASSRQGQRSVIGSLLALFFAGLSQVLRAPTYMRGRQQRDEELSVTVNDPTFEKVN